MRSSLRIRRASSALAVFSALLILLLEAINARAANGTLVLEGARLVDGSGRPAIEGSVLVIENGVISAVGRKGSIKYPTGATVLDLRGKTIIPALIDLHCHLGLTRDGLTQSAASYKEQNIRSQLRKFLAYGVGAVVSLGTDQDSIYELRGAQRAGRVPGARLYTAGRGFGVVGGYPPAIANAPDRYRPGTPEEARDEVRELAAHHPDFVKIWVDDDFGRLPKIRPEIYGAIISEAHRQHLRVIAHVFYLADAQSLVESGIDALGHSVRDQPVSSDLISAMKARGVFYIPTLVRDESQFAFGVANGPAWEDDSFFQKSLAPGALQTLRSAAFVEKARANPDLPRLRAAFAMAQRNLKTMFQSGVRVAFGTDSGPPLRFQGYLDHRELQLMVDSGLSPLEALTCATGNAADVLGQGAKIGILEPGRYADFLLLDASPLDDIRNTEKLSGVWQAGKPVERTW
jgi:imidazolonepropionase-like amidohydrolase